MIAAGRLQALIESRASGTSIADLMVQMDRIIRVIHSKVPEDQYCGSVIRRPQHAGHGGDHDGHSMPSSGHPLPELPRARAALGQIGPKTGWVG